jgi:hypothetical protein
MPRKSRHAEESKSFNPLAPSTKPNPYKPARTTSTGPRPDLNAMERAGLSQNMKYNIY